MNEARLAAQGLAQRLIELEARLGDNSESVPGPALRAVERLRGPLSILSGPAGYSYLVSRALTLAMAYAPSLRTLRIEPDGSVHPTDSHPASSLSDGATDAETALLTQLLGLLIELIGAPLTLQVVRIAWPDAPIAYIGIEQKETLR